ncbi:major facilitator superfamily domain-containing protein [Hyaloraphidium curvatum]|nr:major facilitator superfamily domain-containing protein [Hyaloraphidium curvatum]
MGPESGADAKTVVSDEGLPGWEPVSGVAGVAAVPSDGELGAPEGAWVADTPSDPAGKIAAASIKVPMDGELFPGSKDEMVVDTAEKGENDETAAAPPPPPMSIRQTPFRAWMVLLAAFVAQLFTWGFIFAGGIWQRYFFTTNFFPGATQSDLAWIGSIAYTVCMAFGLVSGPMSDYIGHRWVFIIGTGLYAVSFLLASFAVAAWQLYLTHGVLWGLAIACIYVPASGVIVQHWKHQVPFAIAISGMGSGIGGFMWPATLQAMLDALGPRWSYRIMAASGLFVLSLCAWALKPLELSARAKRKVEGGERKPFIDVRLFTNWHYWLISGAGGILAIGLYVPTYYLAQYATDVGLDATTGSLLIAVLNGSSLLMRLVQSPLAKLLGSNTNFAMFIALGALCQLVIWPFSKNLASLMVFSILYGFFATGGCFGFMPLVVFNAFPHAYASAIGIIFAWCAPGGLIGPVVSGVLFDINSTYTNGVRTTNYIPMMMFGGGTLLFASFFAVAELMLLRRERGIPLGKWVPI